MAMTEIINDLLIIIGILLICASVYLAAGLAAGLAATGIASLAYGLLWAWARARRPAR